VYIALLQRLLKQLKNMRWPSSLFWPATQVHAAHSLCGWESTQATRVPLNICRRRLCRPIYMPCRHQAGINIISSASPAPNADTALGKHQQPASQRQNVAFTSHRPLNPGLLIPDAYLIIIPDTDLIPKKRCQAICEHPCAATN
jgi:hypothetical protein